MLKELLAKALSPKQEIRVGMITGEVFEVIHDDGGDDDARPLH